MSLPVAVLQFPGLNCEDETLRALRWIGATPSLIRWNERDPGLDRFAGFVIPGGFSYQDRVRAGAIAAKSPLLEHLTREVEAGKPVLGICNGAQILVEAGLAPGQEPGRVELALARNRVPGWEGYHARWVFVQPAAGGRCFFTEDLDEVLPMVAAHGEGRFVSDDPKVSADLQASGRKALVYCDANGDPATSFPLNPNGTEGALAGLSGLDGQVLALMPHPERAGWLWQVPEDLAGPWGARRREGVGNFDALQSDGPGMKLLRAFRRLAVGGGA